MCHSQLELHILFCVSFSMKIIAFVKVAGNFEDFSCLSSGNSVIFPQIKPNFKPFNTSFL